VGLGVYIFINTNANEQVPSKVLTCLLSPSAFAFGADIIADFEYTEVGLQVSNMFDGQFNFGIILVMMFFDFYIYGFLALYLDQVLPHEYGTSEPPWFCFNYRYWCPRSSANENVDPDTNASSIFHAMPEFYEPSAAEDGDEYATGAGVRPDSNIEPIPADWRKHAKVRIKNLRKKYQDGKLAVKDVSLSMLEGQITCLLGHNGAGKTTTIATLTGLIPATSGDVTIYGRSLESDLPSIRQMTGIW
jgi:ABC-type multidrug transport system fused ATPase/permease subunit